MGRWSAGPQLTGGIPVGFVASFRFAKPKFQLAPQRTDHEVAMKPSAWTRDELILALDLYFDVETKDIRAGNPKVIALSVLLGRLNPAAGDDKALARNPNGVKMKLHNFSRFDRGVVGSGLTHGSRLEESVWKEFANRRTALKAEANRIRTSASASRAADKNRFISFARGISPALRALVMESGDLSCEKCGAEPGDTIIELKKVARLYVGRIKDKGRGGQEGPSTLQVICFPCRDGLKQLYKERDLEWLLEQIGRVGVSQQLTIYKHLKEKFGK